MKSQTDPTLPYRFSALEAAYQNAVAERNEAVADRDYLNLRLLAINDALDNAISALHAARERLKERDLTALRQPTETAEDGDKDYNRGS